MRTCIRKIGNSRGILIPSAFLADCGIGDQVDISLEGKTLVIRPVTKLRAGWFTGYVPESGEEPWDGLPLDDGEWTW
ncbi:AbrB/MazE/SpoVT family DNA-binding domain-containing protein [Acidithiobacillus caldus]